MSIRYKFVSVLLLWGLLAGPAAVFTHCWKGNISREGHCPPHCPMIMMKSAAGQDAVKAGTAQAARCCQLSPAKPSPASESMIPKSVSTAALPNIQSLAEAVSSSQSLPTSDKAPPPLIPPSQSALCTFLI